MPGKISLLLFCIQVAAVYTILIKSGHLHILRTTNHPTHKKVQENLTLYWFQWYEILSLSGYISNANILYCS